MAFPANLTNAIDGVTEVMADHLNNLEAKVGIDGSLVTTSLDYLLKNPASVNPGHTHSIYQVAGNYITALTGDIAASGPGSSGATIQAGAVTLAKLANLAANCIIGNNTGSPATPLALSVSQAKSLLAIGPSDVGLSDVTNDAQVKLSGSYSDPSWLTGINASKLLTGSGAVALTAGGTNQNITLTPSGAGYTILNGNVGISTTSPSYPLHVYNASAPQAMFNGYDTISGASSSNGGILFGSFASYQGYIHYAVGGSTNFCFDNSYDSVNAAISFRMRTYGTPVNALTISGSGKVDVGGALNWKQNTMLTSGGLKVAYRTTTYNSIYSGPTDFHITDDSDSVVLLTVLNTGNVGIGTTGPTISGTGKLHMAADRFRLDTAYTPATSGAAGNQGEIAWDANYLYLCKATNTWVRVAWSTF